MRFLIVTTSSNLSGTGRLITKSDLRRVSEVLMTLVESSRLFGEKEEWLYKFFAADLMLYYIAVITMNFGLFSDEKDEKKENNTIT